jgi:WD40 repeat protein
MRDDITRVEAACAEPLTGHNGPVACVAVAQLGGRDIIVSGGADGTVRVWDPAGVPLGAPLTGHDGWVSAVAVGQVGGRDIIVSGGGDGAVRVWDAAGVPLGAPLRGHDRVVNSVVIGQLSGRGVVVSGSYDGTVRIWEPPQTLLHKLALLQPVYALSTFRNNRLIVACGRALCAFEARLKPPRRS